MIAKHLTRCIAILGVFVMSSCATITPPPASGNLIIPVGKGKKVLITLDGNDFMPETLFIALEHLERRGFVPVVEEESIRHLQNNLENLVNGKAFANPNIRISYFIRNPESHYNPESSYYIPKSCYWVDYPSVIDGPCSETVHEYSSWLQGRSISTKGLRGKYNKNLRWKYYNDKNYEPIPTPVVNKKELTGAPILKINSLLTARTYTRFPNNSTNLTALVRIIELISDGKLEWTKMIGLDFPHVYSGKYQDHPQFSADKEFQGFLDRLSCDEIH